MHRPISAPALRIPASRAPGRARRRTHPRHSCGAMRYHQLDVPHLLCDRADRAAGDRAGTAPRRRAASEERHPGARYDRQQGALHPRAARRRDGPARPRQHERHVRERRAGQRHARLAPRRRDPLGQHRAAVRRRVHAVSLAAATGVSRRRLSRRRDRSAAERDASPRARCTGRRRRRTGGSGNARRPRSISPHRSNSSTSTTPS